MVTTKSVSSRRRGAEWRMALWLARHPGLAAFSGAVTAGVVEVGAPTTGGVLLGAGVATAAWSRAHPDSFDVLARPVLRSLRRRWLSRYTGPWWRDVVTSCDLVSTHRRSGEIRFPRVVRVRAVSPTVDVVRVRMVPGQHARQWEMRLPELAAALGVERVAVERHRPMILTMIVQRREPFTEIIDAPDMPHDAEFVDLRSVYLGETEYGEDWTESLLGNHWMVVGATGAGKNSLLWSPLRALAPLIRDGVVRLWFLDPKRMELVKGRGLAYRYAAEPDECVDVATEFVEDMRASQRRFAGETRAVVPSRDTPLNLLVMDEMGALLAYGDYARDFRRLLAEIGSQGRASGHAMLGYVQEPSKDVVPVRDLFTTRVCLRVTTAAHVEMALGEGARLRGATADEIPNDPSTAGIGYVIRPRSRVPMRVRSAYVDDSEINELVEFVREGNTKGLRIA